MNHTGAIILDYFRNGAFISEIKNTINFESLDDGDYLKFIQDSIKNNILVFDKPSETKYNIEYKNNYISSTKFSLTIDLLDKCNLECLHCYNESSPHKNKSLSIELINEIISGLSTYYDDNSQLILTGGEPLLYDKLKDIIEIAESSSIFKKIRINTNGTIFPNKSLLDVLLKYKDKIDVQISILGTNHNEHDKITTKKGSFLKTLNNIEKYLTSGINISFGFSTVNPSEITDKRLKRLINKYKINSTYGNLLPYGRAIKNKSELTIDEKPIGSVPNCDSIDKNLHFNYLSKEKLLSMREHFPPRLPCGLHTIHICSDGRVLPCTYLQNLEIGNIHYSKIMEIIKSDVNTKFRENIAIDNRDVCSICELRYVCENKCPAISYMLTGKISNKNPNCTYY